MAATPDLIHVLIQCGNVFPLGIYYMSYFALTSMLVGAFFNFGNPTLAVATSIHLKKSE